MQFTRLSLFSLLFAWTNLIHECSFPTWIKTPEWISWSMVILALCLALRPSSVKLLLSLLAARAAYTLHWIPMIRGHLFLEGLLVLSILLALTPSLWRMRKLSRFTTEEEEDLFEWFAPFLRMATLLVYGAVTLSKLNPPFFDPATSAAAEFVIWAHQEHAWVPTAPWALQAGIYGTLLFEGGIPILLCFRRTRWWGLLAGLFFHTLLGLHPLTIASFSMTMVLMLASWLPREAPALLENQFRSLAARLRLPAFRMALLGYILMGGTALAYGLIKASGIKGVVFFAGQANWWWQSLIMFWALLQIRSLAGLPARSLLKPAHPALWIVVAVLLLNCLSPYLGLKTRTALIMHCNLRTEGGYWNHLFLPEQIKLFGFQDDLVHIVESNLPDFDHLAEQGMDLPWFEFRRWCRLAQPNFYVVYERNGGPVQRFEKIDGTGSDPILMEDRPVLEYLLCFNPVGSKHDYMPGFVRRVGPSRNIVPKNLSPTK